MNSKDLLTIHVKCAKALYDEHVSVTEGETLEASWYKAISPFSLPLSSANEFGRENYSPFQFDENKKYMLPQFQGIERSNYEALKASLNKAHEAYQLALGHRSTFRTWQSAPHLPEGGELVELPFYFLSKERFIGEFAVYYALYIHELERSSADNEYQKGQRQRDKRVRMLSKQLIAEIERSQSPFLSYLSNKKLKRILSSLANLKRDKKKAKTTALKNAVERMAIANYVYYGDPLEEVLNELIGVLEPGSDTKAKTLIPDFASYGQDFTEEGPSKDVERELFLRELLEPDDIEHH